MYIEIANLPGGSHLHSYQLTLQAPTSDPFPLTSQNLVWDAGTRRIRAQAAVPVDQIQFKNGSQVATMRMGLGTGGILPNEVVLQNSGANFNVLALQNNNAAGWSSLTIRDKDGLERGAFGFGNSGVVYNTYQNAFYWESGATPTRMVISQGHDFGSTGLGPHPRQAFELDGWIRWHRKATGSDENSGTTQVMALHPDIGALFLGADTGADGNGIICSTNALYSVHFRRGGNSANGQDYSCGGGTLAANGGHRFFAQAYLNNGNDTTAEFQVATDRTKVRNKLNIGNIPTSASGLVSGDVWSNSGILTIVA